MRLNKIDLNLFVVFDIIYTERNLTRAAEVLCLTQPTVSNALSRLRKTFSDELFVRTPQGMLPTPVAENNIGQIREALQLLGKSVHEGEQFDPGESSRVFRLSMTDVGEALLLPELMADLGRLAPGMMIESYHTSRRDLPMALSSGQLTLAMDIPEVADINLCHAPLFEERHVCVVRNNHPGIRGKLTLKQYLKLGHINVSNRRKGVGLVDAELNKLGHKRQVQLRLQHYMVAPEIVRHSDLALTVPKHWARETDLQILELPFEVPVQKSHLFWHKSADGDHANRWLRERILRLCELKMSPILN